MSLLVAHGLSLPARVPDGRAPLEGPIDLELAPGERLAVVGPSGAGKTTLLRLLMRLEPGALGEVRFGGQVVAGDVVPRYRRRVQYLPQTAVRLAGSVEDNLRAASSYVSAGRAARFDPDAALRLCAELGLQDVALSQPARTLSGGEAQRLALVRALLLQPQVLLLDEPTASLDADTRERVEGAVLAFVRQQPDRALLLVSHDPAQRARMTTRQLNLLPGGKPVALAEGQPEP